MIKVVAWLVFGLVLSIGPSRVEAANYSLIFAGQTFEGDIVAGSPSGSLCRKIGDAFSATWDARQVFPNSVYYPGGTYGGYDLNASYSLKTGEASTLFNAKVHDVSGAQLATQYGPGCIFRGPLGAAGAYINVFFAATEVATCDLTTNEMVSGQCVAKCSATQERDASGQCVAACQQSYVAGLEFLAGQSKVVRECIGAGGITVVDGSGGSSTAPVRPYCWHYVGSKIASGVNTNGTYYEDYSLYTQAGDVCASLGTKECTTGSCPVVNDPNAAGGSTGGTTSGTSGGSGGSTTPSTTAGAASGYSLPVSAGYCQAYNDQGLCNADGTPKTFGLAAPGHINQYNVCSPQPAGATSEQYCLTDKYSSTDHSQVCHGETGHFYSGPSAAGYYPVASSPSSACLASGQYSAKAINYIGASPVAGNQTYSQPYENVVYHCQYTKIDVGGGAYRWTATGATCLSPTGTSSAGTGDSGSTGGTTGGSTGDTTGGTTGGTTTTTTTEPPVTSPGVPSVPGSSSFYNPTYPNGISGVVQSRVAEVRNTGFVSWLQGFNVSDAGSWEPKWTLSLGKFGEHVIEIPPWIMSALRALVVVMALITARKIVFGG